MILYCDTSAFMKLYFHEIHSEGILKLRRQAEAVAISVVGYAEFWAATNRKSREGDLEPGVAPAPIEEERLLWRQNALRPNKKQDLARRAR